ncbi:MAG: NifU family protein [Patescibacteria group bacterium]|jgi:Fe-S cluster biogenesis protein NfuA|nr:NifU family protein [Patescibacteria group bacterium]
MKEEVKKVLDQIRPSLQADGGDVELISVNAKTGIVKVRLQGACAGCPMSQLTLQEGIGRVLRNKVKGFKSIEAV